MQGGGAAIQRWIHRVLSDRWINQRKGLFEKLQFFINFFMLVFSNP